VWWLWSLLLLGRAVIGVARVLLMLVYRVFQKFYF